MPLQGQASSMSPAINQMFWFMVILCSFTAVLIIGLLIIFSFKYRLRPGHTQSQKVIPPVMIIETIWVGVPLVTFLFIFVWGARLYFRQMNVPSGSLQVYAVAQQWMWKFQHPQGRREINQLHVPVNQPVSITLISQDVIHSFFVPAFRIKMDVIPGRYTAVWFEAKEPGEYRIFCSQYCGTWHSRMTGTVIAMDPDDYQAWIDGDLKESMIIKGKKIFKDHGCMQCHRTDSHVPSPSLNGLFASRVSLDDGQTIRADEAYIRESILDPGRRLVKGYPNVMPTYRHQLSEEDINALIEYIKSL